MMSQKDRARWEAGLQASRDEQQRRAAERGQELEWLRGEVERLRKALAEARALLAERKWNPTEHPQ